MKWIGVLNILGEKTDLDFKLDSARPNIYFDDIYISMMDNVRLISAISLRQFIN